MDSYFGIEIVNGFKAEAFCEVATFGRLGRDTAANLPFGLQRGNIADFEMSYEFGHVLYITAGKVYDY